MTDDPEDTTIESEQLNERIGKATDLIGLEETWSGRVLYTGVKLGIFKILADDSMSATDLADELDLDADATYRLLRALAHFGVLDEDENRCFSLTPVGGLFRADHPHSVQNGLIFNRSPEWVLAMLHLPKKITDYSTRSRRSPRRRAGIVQPNRGCNRSGAHGRTGGGSGGEAVAARRPVPVAALCVSAVGR